MAGYTDKVASYLGIMAERVAVRGEEVLTSTVFDVDNFKKDSLYVTPVGICTNYYTQKNSFVFVTVNKDRIKMYDNNRLTVVDAVMQVGYPNEKLFPRRGAELNFKVNGRTRLVRGNAGEGAVVLLNKKPASLNSRIEQNDVIDITESTVGEAARMTIGQLEEFKSTVAFMVNDKKVICPRFAYVNNELKSEYYEIQNGDDILMADFYTVEQLFKFLDLDISGFDVYVNNEPAGLETRVYENFTVRTEEPQYISSGYDEEYDRDFSAEKQGVSNQDGSALRTDSGASEINKGTDKNRSDAAGSGADKDAEQSREIFVLINHQPVKFTGKKSYVLVDLFDFYKFDLKNPKGKNIVLNLNGAKADYMAPVKDGDVIDLYWED